MEEIYYKIAFAILVALSGIIRGYYELRYLGAEKLLASYEGRERGFVLLVGSCFMVPGLIYIFTGWLDFASIHISDGLRLAGLVVMALNIPFFLWIHYTLGRNWSPILEIFKDQTLITKGPYKYMRHPMYTSIFLHAFMLFPVTGNWVVAVLGILSFGIIYPLRVEAEEKMMIDEFGGDYRDYMKRTGRLFPKLFQAKVHS